MGSRNARIEPEIRTWELTRDSSVYDFLVAAPSNSAITIMWGIEVGVSTVLSLLLSVVVLALVTDHQHILRNPFHIYTICLLLCALLYTFLSLLLNSWNLSDGHVVTWRCELQSWIT